MSLLPRVWEKNEPYPEVLSGILSEDVFAASLAKVRMKVAESIYQDPVEFFDKTYITDALRKLIKEITQKLNGTHPEYNSVYKLETSFGGGKTHCLIALYHAISHPPFESKTYKQIINKIAIPPNAKIVCLDGDEYNTLQGNKRGDGVVIKTLWGDLAYQIGGKECYEKIRINDEKLTSPGSNTLLDIMEDKPVLILIDEPALYFSRAEAVSVGGTTLAKQTNTFLYDLLSAVSKKANAVVVLTLASSKDAFSEYTAHVNDAIREAESIVARKADIVYPTKEDEMYGVVRRRLFKKWDEKIGAQVSDAYYQMYGKIDELNPKYKHNDYLKKMTSSYPFHPELLEVLDNRVSSISSFQKTRGALRLLAKVVADIWKKKENDVHVIMPSYVALDNYEIRNELTGKIGKNNYVSAIQADIANRNNDAKAQVLNEIYMKKKLPPLVSRISNSVYLYSLITGGKEKLGIDINTLLGGVITPGIKYGVYSKILEIMENSFWFFHNSGGRLFFFTEPTINKIIQDFMSRIGSAKIRERLHAAIQSIFIKGGHFKLIAQPSGPSDVPDNDNLKLIVLDYKTTNIDSKEDKIPNIVNQIWNYGKDGKPRVYKNTTYFIVADKGKISRMRDVTKEYEAYQLMDKSKDTLVNLSKEQRNKLEGKKKSVEQDLVIAITNVYRYLFYPRKTLEVAEFDPSVIGEVKKSKQDIIKDLLKSEGKIKDTIKAAYTKSRAWPSHQKEVSTEELKNWFYQKFNLPIPAKLNTIKEMIKDGVKNKIWVYLSGKKVYLPADRLPTVKINKEDKVILFKEAIRRNLCNSEGNRCSKCDKWPCECKPVTGGPGGVVGGPTRPTRPGRRPPKKPKIKPYEFESDKGLPEIIIHQFEEDFEEKKPDIIEEFILMCDNTTAAKSIITMYDHFPDNEEVNIDLELFATAETPKTLKKIKFEFSGATEEYRELYNGIHSFLEKEKIRPEVSVNISFSEKPKTILDNFFMKLKNYNTLEYKIQINGLIKPK